MTCASCVGRVERSLQKLPGVHSASVNLATEQANIHWTAPADAAAIIATVEKGGYTVPQRTWTLQVQEMTCASCVGRVERLLKKQPGVLDAQVNLATERAVVQALDGLDPGMLQAAVTQAGYPAQLVQAASDSPVAMASSSGAVAQRHAQESVHLYRDMWVAMALALPVFALEMGGHLWPALHHWVGATIGQQNSWLLQWLLTTGVLIGPGRRLSLIHISEPTRPY